MKSFKKAMLCGAMVVACLTNANTAIASTEFFTIPNEMLKCQMEEYFIENGVYPTEYISPVEETVEIEIEPREYELSSRGNEEQRTYINEFELTAYCNCVKCCGKWSGGACANGEYPTEGVTIAVDPKVIPLNTYVYIDGIGERKAQDTGSAIKGNRIDVYFNDHNEALKFGRQKNIKVYKIER